MEELMNMIISDESPSQISDAIKDILFAKTSEKINNLKPSVAASFFDASNEENEEEFEN
jgi:hypothetical protein